MNTNPTTPGADFDCSEKPWCLYIWRNSRWVPCGRCGDRPLAEAQIATLRRLMPRHHFAIAWEGGQEAA